MNGITEEAGAALEAVLTQKNSCSEACVRLSVTADGDGALDVDKELPGDCVFRHNERKVLVVGPDAAQRWNGKTLDFADSQFHFV